MRARILSSLFITILAVGLISCSKKKASDEGDTASDITSFDTAGEGLSPGTRIAELATVYFEYDSFALDSTSKAALDAAAQWLSANPGQSIQVEGHCDERGTTEYNLALGERRAGSVKDYLVSRGVSAGQVSIISYGEERPAVEGMDESAWAQNRRAEFVSAGNF
ncbi:peptidoglycan-associated lipoprotein Pal [bacterium]|nr:peptidoglycan-associated lipoprotein Pal [bacterium]